MSDNQVNDSLVSDKENSSMESMDTVKERWIVVFTSSLLHASNKELDFP